MKSPEQGVSGVQRANFVGKDGGDESGWLSTPAAHISQPCCGLDDIIKCRSTPVGTAFSKADHGAINEVRVEFDELFESQAESLRGGRTHVDQERVGASDQPVDDLLARGAFQVDGNDALVAVVVGEERAPDICCAGRSTASDVPLDGLQLDHFGAQVGQYLPGQRPHNDRAQFEESHPF